MSRYNLSSKSEIKVIACQKCGDSWVPQAEPGGDIRDFRGNYDEYLKAQGIEV